MIYDFATFRTMAYVPIDGLAPAPRPWLRGRSDTLRVLSRSGHRIVGLWTDLMHTLQVHPPSAQVDRSVRCGVPCSHAVMRNGAADVV